jgi:hypothetical protein
MTAYGRAWKIGRQRDVPNFTFQTLILSQAKYLFILPGAGAGVRCEDGNGRLETGVSP